ncbi:MAG: DEAD/DEAH box helicase [Treponema sp. CETP13]|nr:MAG: DEAD/DEAH box helicase [Treponema sp. CETP13]
MTKERQIEDNFIKKLQELKYVYRDDICDLDSLNQNFREKFNALNKVNFTDSEFARLLDDIVSPDVFKSAKKLRERNSFEREDGTPLNYTLVNTKDWCKNSFECVNQLRINTENSNQRYDVILLINGIPVVQVELKALAISPRRAMQQIVEYKNERGNGYGRTLLCFMQIFVVSNRSNTWYFANNNTKYFSFDADEHFLPLYEFADKDNKKITHLDDFSDNFLQKCTLGEMISRYMVLVECEQKLMMMRPYQIYAVKAIVDCIHQNRGNGYIWHTTGSGKTLTSFKASTLLKDNDDIKKCLFVVDRKDLDRQTRQEFNKFQKGCVEENTNTETLVERLLSTNYADKVIVTTIQKLGIALDGTNKKNYKERLEPLRKSRVVFIFDECHRSQFGKNNLAIKEFFPNSQLFGFTGTPIFEENASQVQIEGQEKSYRTTEDIFQKLLHSYTITNAIEDRNVLRFHIEYYKPEGKLIPKPGESLSQEAIVNAILEKHYKATANREFNALFATSSINQAIEYYKLFKLIQTKKLEENPKYVLLNIACVFSPPADGNKDILQIQEDLLQEKLDNQEKPEEKKQALKEIISDYNFQYGTNHDIANFDLYYQDIQKRIKDQQYSNSDYSDNKKIDITIVVDMLLTGFDSKYLNTVYVDKTLKYHGLIQAFSRTNRVLNDTKPYGNILDFRGQQDAVNEAIALFSGEENNREKEIWLVDPAPVIITKLDEAVSSLNTFMTSQGLKCAPEEVANLKGDESRGQFVNLFKEVQRLKTQIDQYTDLTEDEKEQVEQVLPQDDLYSFRGVYLETAARLKLKQDTSWKEETTDIIQNLDFEFVLFASAMIDYDYIMQLISEYTQNTPEKQNVSREELIGLIASDSKFIEEKENISEYIATLKTGKGLSENEIRNGYELFKAKKYDAEIATIAQKHKLQQTDLKAFITDVVTRLIFDGDALTDLFEPLELGWKVRSKAEGALVKDLSPLLHKMAHDREISGLKAYEE